MRTSFVLTIVSLFLLGAAVADISVCQTSTYELKVEMRALNAWRAACEDYNWKGAACYNYWAQLDEVMTLENNLQTCLTGIFQDQKKYMLGDATTAGAYSQDAKSSRDVSDTTSGASQAADIAQQTTNRAHVTTKTNEVIKSATDKLTYETTETRKTVQTEFDATRKYESATHTAIRGLENASAQRILDTINSQEGQTRQFVDDSHNVTSTLVVSTETQDGKKAREDNNNQESYNRATHYDQYTTTLATNKNESSVTQAADAAAEKKSRENTRVAQDANRAHTTDEHAQTNVVVNDLLTSVNDEVDAQTAPIIANIKTDANTTRNAAADASQQSRALFASLQSMLVGSYGAEAATMADMWSTLIKLLVHFDLQGKCEKWSETFTFATMSSIGISRFDQLRTETLATLTYNEQYYGTNSVGWARWYWEQGERYYTQNNLRAAADQYRLSYNSATQSR